jgi:2'-5' RNA ligase
MNSELEDDLLNSINEFSAEENYFHIQLKNFSNFKPRVIYVDVSTNELLPELKNKLTNFLLGKNKFPFATDDHPFHPHVTIATRDLYKKAFYEAWDHFKDKHYEEDWLVNGVSLLRHNKKNWDVIATSQLKRI